MAFERDFVERFKEDGRNELLTYHKALKETHLKMVPTINSLAATAPRPGDQRFTQHFTTLAQREEHNMMSLIGPPDRADHEVINVSPEVAAMIYSAYAAFNAARCEQIRAHAPADVIDHLGKVTLHLQNLAETAKTAEGKVGLPIGLMNLAYDSVLAEVDPKGYDRAMVLSGTAH